MSDPRHRRRHRGLRAARRAARRHRRRRAAPRSCCRTRRRPAWSSSTPSRMADAALDVRPRGAGRGRPGRRRRHRQPAGVDDRVGPRHRRAGRPRRSAGRTCAPSATASCCQAEGLRLAPNASATKVAPPARRGRPRPRPATCASAPSTPGSPGTSPRARVHVTDADQRRRHRPASTGDGSGWDDRRARRAAHPAGDAARRIVDSTGVVGAATALDGAPPIAGIAGDQQASLIGQGCVAPGPGQDHLRHRRHARRLPRRRATRASTARAAAACFPIVAWRRGGDDHLGRRGVMLSAGTNVEWLRDDLGLIATRRGSHDVASRLRDTDGVVVRARPARPRHARAGTTAPAARCSASPGAPTRPHDRAGRARGRRPARRRPGRGGRGRQRRSPSRRCASTAA